MTRLLSIGRFSEAKNYDNVPDICRRIVDHGVDVKWYIIGFGGDEHRDESGRYAIMSPIKVSALSVVGATPAV